MTNKERQLARGIRGTYKVKEVKHGQWDVVFYDLDGHETCLRTSFPMHVQIVDRLLKEAGYVPAEELNIHIEQLEGLEGKI